VSRAETPVIQFHGVPDIERQMKALCLVLNIPYPAPGASRIAAPGPVAATMVPVAPIAAIPAVSHSVRARRRRANGAAAPRPRQRKEATIQGRKRADKDGNNLP
jgi:hypothetical protein